MAYDEGLAARIREVVADRLDVTEKRMFGGLAFLVNGKLACAVHHDDLLVRLPRRRPGRGVRQRRQVNAALHEFPAGDWERVVAVNLVGVFLTSREALRRLVDAGRGGSVVCTSPPAAFVGHSGGGNSSYAAPKGGVSAFARSAALDYAPHGIRVNAVVPGATDTAMLTAGGAGPDRLRAAAATQIPLGRLGRPDEVAAAVLWLLSGESSYVTGSHLVCDGGLMAKSVNDF